MKKVLIPVIVIAVGVVLYLAFGNTPKEEPQVRYIVVPVEKGTLTAEINASGTLRPMVEVLVGSQVSGTIKELYADFESQVTKGQLVALIDPAMYKAKVEQAKADLAAAEANLAKSEVTRDDELTTLRRKTGLVEKGSISQSEFDNAKAKAEAAVAQVGVDRARVEQMKAKLNEAALQLEYTSIEAPVSGVVTSRSMDVGQTVTASFQTPVLFKIAEDLTRMQVHTNVDEADIGRVKEGQKAIFTVAAFPDESFEASVTQIRNDPKIEQNVVTYDVVLDVENKGFKLRPGMTADVHVLLTEVHDALMVPDQALRFSPPKEVAKLTGVPTNVQAGPGERILWKLLKENRIVPIKVKVGVTGTERVQVFSDKLKPGDRVVVDTVVKKGEGTKPKAIRFRF